MRKTLKKYRFIIIFVLPLFVTIGTSTTSCNLYRPGATVKPVGGGGGTGKYHTKTASSKGRKKRKY